MRFDDSSFDEYQSSISRLLSEPSESLPPRTWMRCVAWEFPSFETRRSWTVGSEPGSSDRYSVVELSWNESAAYKAVSTRAAIATQTHDALKIARRCAPLDATETRRLLDEVAAIRLAFVSPAHDPTMRGLDGTDYGFTLRYAQIASTLSWWGPGPDEWREVVAWAERLRVYLAAAIEERGVVLPPFDPTWSLVVEASEANLTATTKVLREELHLAIGDVTALRQALRSGSTVMRSTRTAVDRVAARVREAGVIARVFANAERGPEQ